LTRPSIARKKDNELKITQLNLQYLHRKIHFLESYLQLEDIDILIASEHGLKEDEIDTIKYKNFNVVSSYSRESKKSGGVAIICRNSLFSEIVRVESVECQFECVCVEVKTKYSSIFVVSVYRSPDPSNLTEFFNYLEDFCLSYLEN
jgi:exonuclease III